MILNIIPPPLFNSANPLPFQNFLFEQNYIISQIINKTYALNLCTHVYLDPSRDNEKQ